MQVFLQRRNHTWFDKSKFVREAEAQRRNAAKMICSDIGKKTLHFIEEFLQLCKTKKMWNKSINPPNHLSIVSTWTLLTNTVQHWAQSVIGCSSAGCAARIEAAAVEAGKHGCWADQLTAILISSSMGSFWPWSIPYVGSSVLGKKEKIICNKVKGENMILYVCVCEGHGPPGRRNWDSMVQWNPPPLRPAQFYIYTGSVASPPSLIMVNNCRKRVPWYWASCQQDLWCLRLHYSDRHPSFEVSSGSGPHAPLSVSAGESASVISICHPPCTAKSPGPWAMWPQKCEI